MKKLCVRWLFAGLVFWGMSVPAFAGELPAVLNDAGAIEQLESLAVQHGGRVKPFRSFAQEAVLYITGRTHWKGNDPTALIFSWLAQPAKWRQAPVFKVAYKPLREQLSLKADEERVSIQAVLDNGLFASMARKFQALRDQSEKLTALQEKHLDLYSRASYMQALAQARVPGVLANSASPEGGWFPLEYLQIPEGTSTLQKMYTEDKVRQLSERWNALLDSLRRPDEAVEITKRSAAFMGLIDDLYAEWQVPLDRDVLAKELFYHRVRPIRKAWMLYGLALLISLLGLYFGGKAVNAALMRTVLQWGALGLFAAAIAVHTYGIYLRVIIAGRPPVSNMYESMIWVAWVVAALALIYYLFNRSSFVLGWSALVATFVLLLAEGFPVVFSPAIDTLVPVLRSNLWLTVHVLTITMSYGAFALAWGLGHGIIYQATFSNSTTEPNREHVLYLHRIVLIGVVLLAAGTILGGVWANYSWGRYWGWDPKETWALIALLGYLAVLHARFTGWFGNFEFAAGAVVAFQGVVMAWYGVNYVLAAGLHSYGFGGGGSKYVLSVVALDFLFVAACILKRKANKKGLLLKLNKGA